MAENTYLTGAFFDNNMPQWATEETLSRLSQQIKSSNNLSNNQQNKIINLLQGISQSLKSGDEKKMLEEMEKFNKSIEKARSDITDQNKQSTKEITSHIDKQTQSIDKQTEAIEKQTDAINRQSKTIESQDDGSGGPSRQSGKPQTSSSEGIRSKDIQELSESVNTNIKSVNKTLSDFHGSFINISTQSLKATQGTKEAMFSKEGSSGGSSTEGDTKLSIEKQIQEGNEGEYEQYSPNYKKQSSGKDKKQTNKQSREPNSSLSELTDNIADTNDNIRDIIDLLKEKDSQRTDGDAPAIGGDQTDERIRQFGHQARNQRSLMRRGREKIDRTKHAGSKIKQTVNMLDSTLGKLIAPLTVFSTALSGLTALKAAFEATTDIVWTAQKEVYNAMHETGVSFTTFNTNLQNVEDDIRMDGIRLRRMIGEAGILAEQGIDIIKKNTVLMNRMGTQGFFGAIENIAGDAKDMESFMNQMMLSREQIANFTAEYMSSLIKVGGQLRMNEKNRQEYLQQFIKDASAFGRVVGKGMDAITERISEMRDDDRSRLMQMKFQNDPERMRRFEKTSAFLTSLNVGEDVKTAFEDALYDPRGIGLRVTEMGQNIMNTMHRLNVGGAGRDINELIKGIQQGDVDQKQFAKELRGIRESIVNSEQPQEEINALLSSGDPQMRRAAQLITGIKQINDKMLEKIEKGEVMPSEAFSNLTQQQKLAKSAIEATKAQLEEEKAKAFDTDGSREAAVRSFEAGVAATEITNKIAHYVSSIASVVLDTLPTILDYIESIYNLLPWVDSAEEKKQQQYYEKATSENKDLAGSIKAGTKADNFTEYGFENGHNKNEQKNEALKESTKNNLELLARAKETNPSSQVWEMLRERGLNDYEIKDQIEQVPELMKMAGEKYGEEFVKKIERSAKHYKKIADERQQQRYKEDLADMTSKQLRSEMEKLNLQKTKTEAKAAIPEEFTTIGKNSNNAGDIQSTAKERLEELEKRTKAVEDSLEKQRQDKIDEFNKKAPDALKEKLGGEITQDMVKNNNLDVEKKTDTIESSKNIEDSKDRKRMIELLQEIARSTRNTENNTQDNI
ncbi:hypothetical protein PBI_SCTP2_89 [Salicola phage SCTP-2]|nr:hypothetical protein PBI_SCTP2_89 [Salicola phage SCTP-2]